MTATATRFGDSSNWAFELAWVVLAVAVHAAVLGGMPGPSRGRSAIAITDPVDVDFIDEPLVEPEEPDSADQTEPAEPEPPDKVEPPPKPRTFKAPKEAPKVPDEPPAAAKETPVSFDNVVLTNESESDSSWSTTQASGKSVEGPIGSPDSAVTGRSQNGIVGGVVGGSGTGVVVEVGDLSKAPIPPPLKQKLERLYPKKARAEGVEGEAVVRLQIGPDGLPSKVRLISETPEGYALGAACIQTLRGEKWGAPVSKDGTRVSTRVTYRCGFEIRY